MMKGARGMKVGATRKGFYMFSRDLLSSRRYRCCSWVAKGVYLDLLNVMAVQPKPGAVCLTDFDLKPKSERSLTLRCLQCQKKAKNGEYQSIKYFAEAIAVSGASGPRPGLIHGLQELYLRGMIVIEGDMLIQPRMYQDNGYRLAADADTDEEEVVTVGSPDDGETDPDAEALRLGKEGGVKGAEKGTQNVSKKTPKKSRVDARDARAQSRGVELEVNNNKDNSIGNIGGIGGNNKNTTSTTSPAPSAPSSPAASDKTQENAPTTSETARISTNGGEVGQLPAEEEKPRQKPLKSKSAPADQSQVKQKSEVADNPPTLADVQAYADERAQQGKPFLYVTPEEFFNTCEMDGWKRKGKPLFNWKAYMLRFEQYRKDHGEPTIEQRGQSALRQPQTIPKPGDPVAATKPTAKKYKDKW